MCSNQSSTIRVRVTPEDLFKDNEGKASYRDYNSKHITFVWFDNIEQTYIEWASYNRAIKVK